MSNIIIGLVARNEEKNDTIYQAITKNNLKMIENKCSYIGILNYDDYGYPDIDVLKLCDGIIFQGGSILYDYNYEILDYAIKNHIPVLGICLGNQLIGLHSTNQKEEDLIEVENHYLFGNKKHKVTLKEGSILYKLFGESIMVNSRHKYALKEVSLPFKVSAYSEEGIIEAVEYIDEDNFILGLQWHPEDMDKMDNIYNEFISRILRRKNSDNN